MLVYQSEINAGLASAIQASGRFTVACQTKPILSDDKFWTSYNKVALLNSLPESIAKKSDSFDLYPVRTVMVTTGWNGNTDIFDRVDTWAARHSPVNKPFNVGHIPRQIIGHIVSSYGMTTDYVVLDDDIAHEDLPNQFHIVTDAVIYRHFGQRDPELTQEVANIITGIENGDWYVSMECLFDGFDYGLRDLSTGEETIVPRQESTAFLTKHLRQYNGSGTYANYAIGRVLRGITFSGKGLVENPANPNSIFIFNDAQAFIGVENPDIALAVESIDTTDNNFNNIGEDNIMSEKLEAQVAELQRQLAEANAKLRETDQAAINAEREAKVAAIAKLDETIAVLNTRIQDLEKSNSEIQAQLEEANSAKTKAEEELADATAKLTQIKAEAKQTERISTLVDKGVDKVKAEEIVAEFADLSDEKFGTVVKMQVELVEALKTPQVETQTQAQSADSEQQDDGEVEGESTADEQALEGAEEDSDADLASAGESSSDERNRTQAELSQYLGTFLGNR